MTETAVESAGGGNEVPYLPSWMDRLTGWIDGLLGPAWLFYGLALLGTALLNYVIISHGEPVHDRAAYERALELPPWSADETA